MQFQNWGKSLKPRLNHFINAPVGKALSQSDCCISGEITYFMHLLGKLSANQIAVFQG